MKKELLLTFLASFLLVGCGGGSGGGDSINDEDRDGEAGNGSVIGSIDTSDYSGAYFGAGEDITQALGKIYNFDVTDNGYVEFSYISTSSQTYQGGGYIDTGENFTIKVPFFKLSLFGGTEYVGDATLNTTFLPSDNPQVPYQINYSLSTPIDDSSIGKLIFTSRAKVDSDLSMLEGIMTSNTEFTYDASENLIVFVSDQGCKFSATPNPSKYVGLMRYNFDAVIKSATCDVRKNTAVAISAINDLVIGTQVKINVFASDEIHTFFGTIKK